ncbi:hypothetical protein RRG08_042680 [Elysia crispata]|uniref:Uncharacterized protein n=1 Tax=Elysia crispata TaxID=231223 RepID=A0AAE0XQ93_9GAST|nr:hypothetical protein RRG08_042680 [Elysia crispata]
MNDKAATCVKFLTSLARVNNREKWLIKRLGNPPLQIESCTSLEGRREFVHESGFSFLPSGRLLALQTSARDFLLTVFLPSCLFTGCTGGKVIPLVPSRY